MTGPLGHIGELAKARATKRSSERDDDQALAELEARPIGLPAGLEVEWLGVSGYRLSYEGQTIFVDPYLSRIPLRSLLLRRTALPDPAALEAFVRAPGEVAGVLVGHTHFDHAVDAPAIARRFGCKAYGSDSLVTLMGLHGLAEQTVEVEPYRTYELGPFEVSFTPSVHSKLLLGLAVPYDGDLTCEHLDGLTPNAYRCGQVWGISIRVAGLLFYHQGSANLIDDAIRPRELGTSTSSSPESPGAASPEDYWRRILPRLNPRTVVPTHYDNFFRPLGQRAGVRLQRAGSRSCRRRSARSAPTRGRGAAPRRPGLGAVLGGDLLDRAHRPHRPGAELGLERLQVEIGVAHRRPSAASRARSPRSRAGRPSSPSPAPPCAPPCPGASGSIATCSLPAEAFSWAARERLSGGDRRDLRRRSAGRPARRSRARSASPASILVARSSPSTPPGASKITLPLARKVATSVRSQASKAARRSSFVIRRPPRFIPRRKAT